MPRPPGSPSEGLLGGQPTWTPQGPGTGSTVALTGVVYVCFCLCSLAVAAQCVPSLMPPGDSGGSGMRLLLVGKSRAGKMTTSTTLLREHVFKSKFATKPATASCAQARCDGEDIMTYKEITHCIGLSSPGPHVLLLVTMLGQFIKEDKEATRKLQDVSGADFEAHDHLTHAEDLARRPLRDVLRYCSNGVLQHLALQCGSKYCSVTAPNPADGHGLQRGVGEQGQVVQQRLEPRLTEKRVEHHVGRYKAERKMRERSRAMPCRITVGCGIILFILAQLSQPLPICQILRRSSRLCRTRSSMSTSLWHTKHSAPWTRAALQPREPSCKRHIFLREIIN
uniref:AIG1-type G domain-containing protein n=1 Tax=Otus sunia TaxID=257818 RepID=A0A8C8AUE6_9STRI